MKIQNCLIKDHHNNNINKSYLCTLYDCKENVLCCNECIVEIHKDHKSSDFKLIENIHDVLKYKELQKL